MRPATDATGDARRGAPEFRSRRADASGWLRHSAGQLAIYVRPNSAAARDADELSSGYQDALAAVSEVLEIDPATLPHIDVYLADQPATDAGTSGSAQHADRQPDPLMVRHAGSGRTSNVAESLSPTREPPVPETIAIRTSYGAESPSSVPEVELTHALLAHSYGRAEPGAHFWDDGLAGYVAVRAGRSVYRAEADAHCRQLLGDGGLPPLAEIVTESSGRVSALGSTAACSFANYVIERYGVPRYRQLLREARSDATDPFAATYAVPLAIADRDWRRHLEATSSDAAPTIRSTLLRLAPIARPYWRVGLALLVCASIGVGFSLALPLSFRFLLDNIIGRNPLRTTIPFVGPQGHTIGAGQEQLDVLLLLLTALGTLYLVNAASKLAMSLLLGTLGEAIAFDLRERLVGIVERLPASYFARRTPTDLTQQVINDVETVQSVVTRGVVPLVVGAIASVCFAILLFVLESKLATIVAVGLPIVALLHAVRRNGRRSAARERVRRISDLTGQVAEAASAHVLTKVFGAGAYLTGRLVRRMEQHRLLNQAYSRENAVLAQSGTLMLGLIQVSVLLYGAYIVVASEGRDLAPGSLVAFYIVLNQLLGPIGQVSTATQSIAAAAASVERAADLLSAHVEEDRQTAREVGPLAREIRFEGVSFAYPDGELVLRNVSLTITAGQTVAFVGPSGAGKSSILGLLPRLYEPTRGRITWDGLDLRDARRQSLRRQIGMVQQEPLLLSASVYDNIRFGDDAPSDEAVERVAVRAAADESIRALPQGYDTMVGQGGVGLSGGQRQRIALARALLREPSLTILDEATSALDASTQRAVHLGLRDADRATTTIKVAHRLETVVDADTIFVLDGGRLVEQGKHDDLIAQGGLYARLVEDQTAPFQDASNPSARMALHRLRQHGSFTELTEEDVTQLARHLEPIEVRAGRDLYHHGDEPDALYVLMRGRIELRFSQDRGRTVVETVKAGRLVGDHTFLTERRRPATAHVIEDAHLFRLSRDAWSAITAR